jgi:hypothetical protein
LVADAFGSEERDRQRHRLLCDLGIQLLVRSEQSVAGSIGIFKGVAVALDERSDEALDDVGVLLSVGIARGDD